MSGVVIVGAGQAGMQVGTTLRDRGYGDRVTLVGEEPYLPYSRPPLSKGFLSGDTTADGLALRNEAFYAERNIDVIHGDRVVETLLQADGSGMARTASGRELPFDRLALTTGARPRMLRLPGNELSGIVTMRTISDAERLKLLLTDAEHVIVVGGGFIGLEAAAKAAGANKHVTVLEGAPRLIGRSASPMLSEFYRDAHKRHGVDVRLGAQVTGFSGASGQVRSVLLGDGTSIPADLVIVGVGVIPNTDLAEQLGLNVDAGIVVDTAARTSNLAIVAAGDCTLQPHPLTGRGRYRIESVQNAIAQAQVAAHTILGWTVTSPEVPWFWSDQFDLKLQIAGIPGEYDEQVVRGDPVTEQFAVVSYLAGQLVAVEAVNDPHTYLAVRTALARGISIPPERAGDVRISGKALLQATVGD